MPQSIPSDGSEFGPRLPSATAYVEDPAALPSEVLAACMGSVAAHEGLNAFITVSSEEAHSQALESDNRIRSGKRRPLEGLPIAVKDNFCTAGLRTTAGSRMLSDFIPSYESFVTDRLLKAGAVMVGKTNMDEFGMGSSTENSAFGPSVNPIQGPGGSKLVPGGSSGGSAVAVAANMCVAAIGSDTGGSIRQPAAFCGLVGYKPTYGLCSRFGLIAYASSLDQAGVITRTVGDAALILDSIVSYDEQDSTSIAWSGPTFSEHLKSPAPTLTLGIPKELREEANSSELEALWVRIEELCSFLGHRLVYLSLPSLGASLSAYYIVALSEASSNLARYDGVRFGHRTSKNSGIGDLVERSRSESFGPEVKRRIALGTYALSAEKYDLYYGKARQVRGRLVSEVDAAFQSVDFMVWPTTPTSAFEIGAHRDDPASMCLEDIFTVPVNLVGSPAISIPFGKCSRQMPLGVQIVGQRLNDAQLLLAAKQFETEISVQ